MVNPLRGGARNNGEPTYSQAEIALSARIAMKMAKTLAKEKETNKELIDVSVKSADFHHRMAAAWAYGLTKDNNNCLYSLLSDKHPLVSQAAREACMHIARVKFSDPDVDFGPMPNSDGIEQEDAATLWQSYFEGKVKQRNSTTISPKKK